MDIERGRRIEKACVVIARFTGDEQQTLPADEERAIDLVVDQLTDIVDAICHT